MPETSPIGGYFELELAAGRGEYYPDARKFQSGRAAFLALLQAGRPRRVWIPWYICDSMLEPPRMCGVEIVRYAINESLDIEEGITLREGDWLLYVNYFGVCHANVERMATRFPPAQIVIDNSQAFFSQPGNCLATIHSPRKYFGVPDGGYLSTRLAIDEPTEQDADSIGRSTHLLKRLAHDAETGYADFVAAENSLSNLPPKRMSALTRRILRSIDYPTAEVKRRQNFSQLHEELGRRNQLRFDGFTAGTALCYPYLIAGGESLRRRLVARRIYVPSYWPDVLAAGSCAPSFESRMARELVSLPVDQRYSPDDMRALLQHIAQAA